jgi:hypothetical protein
MHKNTIMKKTILLLIILGFYGMNLIHAQCDPGEVHATISLLTDESGEETTWNLTGIDTADHYAYGGPYLYGAPWIYKQEVCLPDSTDFILVVYDDYADGIEDGYFMVEVNDYVFYEANDFEETDTMWLSTEPQCEEGEVNLVVRIMTDWWGGSETSWELTGTDTTYAEDGPYDPDDDGWSTLYIYNICVPDGEELSFTMFDSDGYGLDPDQGYYSVEVYNHTYVFGAKFESEITKTFTVEPYMPEICPEGETEVTISVRTDEWAVDDETSWALTGPGGTPVYDTIAPGDYLNDSLYIHTYCLSEDLEYQFNIYDVDGIDSYVGYYMVASGDNIIAYGNEFVDMESSQFDFMPHQSECTDVEVEIMISVRTDEYGNETSWELTDGGLTTYASAGIGTLLSNVVYTEWVCIPFDTKLTFTIHDNAGDGIDGGYYRLESPCFTVASGAAFGSVETKNFTIASRAEEAAFEKIIGGQGADHLLYGEQTCDGGYVIAGGTDNNSLGSEDMFFLKLSPAGDTVWSKRLGTSGWDEIYDFTKTSDENFLMLAYLDDDIGYKVFKLNFNGDTLWSRNLMDFDESEIAEISGHNILVAGTTIEYDLFMVLMDQDGEPGWAKAIELDEVFEIVALDQLQDNKLLMAGNFVPDGSEFANPGVVLADSSGDLISSYLFEYEVDEVISQHIISQNEFILTCADIDDNLFVIRANTSGTILDTITFEGTPGDMIRTADGGYMVGLVTYDEEEDEYITLIKTDVDWNEVWSKSFRKPGYYLEVEALLQNSDGGYVIFGNLYDEINEISDIYIRTTDSQGEGCYFVPYEEEEICLATVDIETGKNLVIWEKTPGQGIDYYKIYREGTSAGKYELIDSVLFNNLSVFLDNSSNPRQRSYRYKLSAVDSCGVESQLSFYHKTILLTVNVGVGTMNLSWDDYEYEGGGFTFEKFYIYRGDAEDNLQLIDSIAASFNDYIDTDPPDGTVYYQIAGVLTNPCDANANLKAGSGPYSHSYSNVEERLQVSDNQKLDDSFSLEIFPNPGNGHFNLQLENLSGRSIEIEVIDITGRQIFNDKIHIENPVVEYRLDLGEYSEGVYLLKLTGEGIRETRKLIIQ